MGFYLEYFCDSGSDCHGNEEGPQGRTRAEIYEQLRQLGWRRVKGRGWFCLDCVKELIRND
jgi:hypothetical protein